MTELFKDDVRFIVVRLEFAPQFGRDAYALLVISNKDETVEHYFHGFLMMI